MAPSSVVAPSTAPVVPGTLGRAGAVVLDVAGFREAIDEARVLHHWRDGKAPPMAALAAPALRRRLVIQALETRVVRAEAARRALGVDAARLEVALRNAAEGRAFDAPRPAAEPPPDPDSLEASLATRYQASPAVVRRVAIDLLEARQLAEALLDAESEEAHRQRWVASNTQISLDLLKIPRVPTAAEISEAVRARPADLAAWHARNPALFQRPERARVQRVSATGPDALVRAQALHERALAGESLDVLAQEAAGRPVRPGERELLVTRERLPVAFDTQPGGWTPVVPEGEGFAFYRIESRLPAVDRPLSDESVRREVAAGLLRDEDRLPFARGLAERAAALLASAPDGPELATLVRDHRLARVTTLPFARSAHDLVPEVGLAPELFRAAFELSAARPVTPVLVVRQDYIVGRLVQRVDADLAQWPAQRAAFIARWRATEMPRVVDAWLSEALKGAPLWVDMPALSALDLTDLEKRP